MSPASPAEAAVIAGAIEQFIADTAPPAPGASPASAWQRAALREGVGAKAIFGPGQPDGSDRWQS